MGVGGQRLVPAALPPEKTRYPLYERLGEPHGRSGRMRKISSLPGFDRRTVQPRSFFLPRDLGPQRRCVQKLISGRYFVYSTLFMVSLNGFWDKQDKAELQLLCIHLPPCS